MAVSKIQSESINLAPSTNTFVPFFSSAGATNPFVDDIFTSASYTTQYGRYVRLDNIIHAYVRIQTVASPTYQNGGAASQGISVTMPFNKRDDSEYYPMTTPVYFDVNASDGWSSYGIAGFIDQAAGTRKACRLVYSGTTGLNVDTPFLTSQVANGSSTDIYFNITYETDDA